MSEDVEIIEDDMQIVEISDDDCLFVEECDDLIVIANADEPTNVTNINNSFESPGEPDKTYEQLVAEGDTNDLKIQDASFIILANTENQYVSSEDNDAVKEENVANNVGRTKNLKTVKQTKIVNSDNEYNTVEGSIAHSMQTSYSNTTDSQANSTIRRRRIRKKNRKLKQNTRIGNVQCNKISKTLQDSDAKQKECNLSNEIVQNENTNSTAPEVATTSSSSNNIVSSTGRTVNYDYSKLKWLRPLNNLSSPSHLQIVIIDRSHPDWRIESDKWLMIEKRLLEALNNEMLRSNDISIGQFDGAKWQRGIKIVGCHNENAFNFITKYILSLDKLWYGANLDAFPMSNITRHVVRVYVPPPTLKTDLVMSLMKLQNPSISIKDWKIIKERERANVGGVDIWISINNESLTQLCRSRGEIKYGINRLWLNPSN